MTLTKHVKLACLFLLILIFSVTAEIAGLTALSLKNDLTNGSISQTDGGFCPAKGGTLVVIHFGDPKSFNPDAVADDPLYPVASQIFNKLVTLDANYNVIPDLAESWEVSPNASVYVFHLRKNVKWHDGVPLTCKDVKYTFLAMKNFTGVAAGLLNLNLLKSVECQDDYTVVFKFSQPNAPFLSFVAWYGTFILPEHIYNKTEYTNWMDPKIPALSKPVGTGPFKFVEYVKGSHIILEANKDYFKEGLPCLDRIVFKIVPDAVAAEQTFIAEGDVLLTTPPLTDLPKLNATPGVVVRTYPTPSRWFLAFNMLRDLTRNKDFRFAIAYALNRTDILYRAFSGFGFVAKGMYVPSISWAYNPNAQPPEFNLEKANQILNSLGFKVGSDGFRTYPNGTRLTLKLVSFQTAEINAMSQVIKEQLRKVGIDVSIELLDLGTFQQKAYREKNFDIAITDGFWGPDPHNLYLRFGGGGHNLPGYNNTQFNDLAMKAATTGDTSRRKDLYWSLQEILAQELPIVPLIDVLGFDVYKAEWIGFDRDLPGKVGLGVYEAVWSKAKLTTTPVSITTTQTSISPTSSPITSTTQPTPTEGITTTATLAVLVIVIVIIAAAVFMYIRKK